MHSKTFGNITFIIISFSVIILCKQILDETKVLFQCLFATADISCRFLQTSFFSIVCSSIAHFLLEEGLNLMCSFICFFVINLLANKNTFILQTGPLVISHPNPWNDSTSLATIMYGAKSF